MKRFLFVMTAIAILASSTLCVSADYEVDADGFTTINGYENQALVDGREYGLVIVKGTDAVLDLSTAEKISENVMYINQATAKAGALSFGSIGLKLDGEFDGATAFIGGEGFTTATKIGNLSEATGPQEPTTVKLTGTITDAVAGTRKLASVTVFEGTNAVASFTGASSVDGAAEKFSIDVDPNKTYSVVLTKAGYLDVKYTGVAVAAAAVDMGEINLGAAAGDIDNSDTVAYADLTKVINNYNKNTAEADDQAADIDASGTIAYTDLTPIINNYNKGNGDFEKAFVD